ncbi:MAG: hypothetical protein M0026_12770 [Nocardiopsaceae bacterium]|nr:hypothetical protein [Nocardiopsaceae bacterium]
MGRIVHFEITADDIKRATAFYANAFGWSCTGSPFIDGYEVADTGKGPGIDGAIMRREYQVQPAVLWLSVPDIDSAMAAVREAGGTADSDVQNIPGQGRVTYVRDSEGNVLGLKEPTA